MERLETWLAKLTNGDEMILLGLHIMLIVLVIMIFNSVARRVLLRFSRTASVSNTPLEISLIAAARQPLFALAWVIGISLAIQMAQAQMNTAVLAFVYPARTIGVIACLSWFIIRFIGNAKEVIVSRRLARGQEVDNTTFEAVTKLLRIAVLITTFLVALQSLGFSIGGVLAFGGIGGIAIGFAAKDLLANFFGSLMIYFDRPFAVGDWIRSPEKEIEGTVENIGWRLTCIRTPEKRPLYVPNSVFANITVENPSRMTHRRIDETIGVRYDDIGKLMGIVGDIRAMLRAHPEIDSNQTMIANFFQFSESSLDIRVYAFTIATVWVEFLEIKQDVLLKIAGIIARHGAEIAFPTRVNYLLPPDPSAVGPASSAD